MKYMRSKAKFCYDKTECIGCGISGIFWLAMMICALSGYFGLLMVFFAITSTVWVYTVIRMNKESYHKTYTEKIMKRRL